MCKDNGDKKVMENSNLKLDADKKLESVRCNCWAVEATRTRSY